MLAFLRNWKFWVIFVCSIIGAVGITFGTISIVRANTKMATPANLKIVVASTDSKYIVMDGCNSAISYEIVIKDPDKNSKVITCEVPSYDASAIFNLPGTYTIKARAMAPAGYANSNYSTEIQYVSKIKLSKPVLTLNKAEKKLYFKLTTSYSISLNPTFELYYEFDKKLTEFVTITNDGKGIFNGYFDLSELEAKEYSLTINAIPNDIEHFAESGLSERVVYTAE